MGHPSSCHAFEDVFGEEGDIGEGDAGGVFDGVEDGEGGAVHGELADPFGSGRAVDAGCFFEVDVAASYGGEGVVAEVDEGSVGREGPGEAGGEMLDDLPLGKELLGTLGIGEFERAEYEAPGFEGGDHGVVFCVVDK